MPRSPSSAYSLGGLAAGPTSRRGARRQARLVAALATALALLPPAAVAHAGALPGEAKAQTCFACHGPNGRSATPEVPSLAGQQRDFIVTQLHLFRDGGRKDAQMAPMTVNLSDRDIDDLAAFFAQAPPASPEQPAEPGIVSAAQRLMQRQHCATCHGETLTGQQQVPRLAGQQRAYLAWQLRAYRDGKRPGIDHSMRDATKPLTNQEINTLANYISRLGAP
jgi:cytochrome c553